jgi:thiol-disulfide isomerase/thioredoxin
MDKLKNLTKQQKIIGASIITVLVVSVVVFLFSRKKKNDTTSKPTVSLSKLTTGTFNGNLNHEALQPLKESSKKIFLVYYANWCVHCNVIKPILELTARVAKKLDSDVLFVGIEESETRKLVPPGHPLPVVGFPTIQIQLSENDGTKSTTEYRGNRTVKAFLEATGVELPSNDELLNLASECASDLDFADRSLATVVLGN